MALALVLTVPHWHLSVSTGGCRVCSACQAPPTLALQRNWRGKTPPSHPSWQKPVGVRSWTSLKPKGWGLWMWSLRRLKPLPQILPPLRSKSRRLSSSRWRNSLPLLLFRLQGGPSGAKPASPPHLPLLDMCRHATAKLDIPWPVTVAEAPKNPRWPASCSAVAALARDSYGYFGEYTPSTMPITINTDGKVIYDRHLMLELRSYSNQGSIDTTTWERIQGLGVLCRQGSVAYEAADSTSNTSRQKANEANEGGAIGS